MGKSLHRTAHQTFLESRHPYCVSFPEGSQKKVSSCKLVALTEIEMKDELRYLLQIEYSQ